MRSRIIFLILFSQYICFIPVLGCTTPVFRYALERWPAYLYRVEVVHSGNLNDDQKRALNYLKESSVTGIKANLKVVEISDIRNEEIRKEELPVIRLFYPKEHNIHGLVWQGALSNENVRKLVDSPARRKAVHQIQKGDAVVWFFLESGIKSEDNKLAESLEEQLNLLSDELKLSSSATDATGKPLDIIVPNNKVKFSMVRISNTNPAEEIFIKMLLGTELDLASFHAPLAFPVFGRGRVLYALAGKGIKPELIKTACNAVIGWCSCTIKEENAGTDLLFKADWEKAIGDTSWIQEEIPEISGISDFIPSGNKKEVVEVTEKKEGKETEPEAKETARKNNTDTVTGQIVVDSDVEEPEEPVIDKSATGPLRRNILIVIVLLVIAVPTVSYILKKK
ncbi:MAG: hypothetical protein KAR19_16560 [Bacteroidales bacterium]|nr:hypothetical protein [Bacteroidales bacterium]